MKSNFKNQKVLVRVDFNVPMTSDHKISDNTRIVKAMPTLNYILENGGSLILISHLGRPTKAWMRMEISMLKNSLSDT